MNTDPVSIIKTLAPYLLAAGCMVAVCAEPNLSDFAKTTLTLVIGAALAVIDPSRKPPTV